MSRILESAPGPIPGKGKDTEPCRSLFAGLGESKRGPEATKEEEASGVEKEDIGGGKAVGLGESKLGPEATKEEEASGVEKDDIGDDKAVGLGESKLGPEATKEEEARGVEKEDIGDDKAVGLGESKRGPEATKEEEASGVEKEDIGGGEAVGIFDKMRKRVREEMKQKEANGGVRLGILEEFERCNELFRKKLKEEEANGGGEKKEEEDVEKVVVCQICEEKGHPYYNCSWLKKLPPGRVPADLHSDWMVECTYCHGLKFEDETGNCESCKRGTKKVVEKICYICWQTGHFGYSEDCLIYGQDPETDPFSDFYKS